MANEDPPASEIGADPSPAESEDSGDDQSRPADESYLLGATGVEEQVLAELARAEGDMTDTEEVSDEGDGAVV
jgi:hypothetical protein